MPQKQTILLTGSTGGLGNFLAKYFISRGHTVISIDKKKIDSKQSNFHQYVCDLRHNKKLELILQKIYKKFSKLDLFVSCAAKEGNIGKPENTEYQSWLNVFKINIFSQSLIINYAAKMMKNNKFGGTIILFSGGGSTTYPIGIRKNLNEYSCSKIALIKFSENLASSFVDQNIKINVNVIAPGLMPTKMSKNILKKGGSFLGDESRIIQNALENKNTETYFLPVLQMIDFLFKNKSINGKVLSPTWDKIKILKKNIRKISKNKNIYTIRRIIK